MQKPRPPVVTVMGHIDHGKTTLLSAIKKTRMPREEGDITQHIGASQIETMDKRRITFIDTPGHAAFENMRSRGAAVADIVILVVAVDDGVKPQTIEAIRHIKAANVPMVVAINKIDLPETNVDRVKQELAEHGVLVEGYGGDVVVAEVSATKGTGIDGLLEMVLLVADMRELSGDPTVPFRGVVIESRIDPRRGPLASLIVQEGTLRKGDPVAAAGVSGKVRNLFDAQGKSIQDAGPSVPVEVLGFDASPPIGSIVTAKDESVAPAPIRRGRQPVEAILRALDRKHFNIIVKADTEGSLEAVVASVKKLKQDRTIDILGQGTGSITDSDVMRAEIAGATIIGFRINAPSSVKKLAEVRGVSVKTYAVIYDLLEDIETIMRGEEKEEKVHGIGKIVKIFPGKVPIAGTKLTAGVLHRGGEVDVFRGSHVVGRATIVSMRHLKETIEVCTAPGECGIILVPPLDFQEGDTIQS